MPKLFDSLTLAVVAAGLMYSAPSAAVDWKQHPYDKISHIAIGGALSCGVTAYTKKPLYGVLAAVLVGTVKEITDKNFDKADLASWGVGGAVGALCFKF
jgi:hypothetical protein